MVVWSSGGKEGGEGRGVAGWKAERQAVNGEGGERQGRMNCGREWCGEVKSSYTGGEGLEEEEERPRGCEGKLMRNWEGGTARKKKREMERK